MRKNLLSRPSQGLSSSGVGTPCTMPRLLFATFGSCSAIGLTFPACVVEAPTDLFGTVLPRQFASTQACSVAGRMLQVAQAVLFPFSRFPVLADHIHVVLVEHWRLSIAWVVSRHFPRKCSGVGYIWCMSCRRRSTAEHLTPPKIYIVDSVGWPEEFSVLRVCSGTQHFRTAARHTVPCQWQVLVF